MCEKAVVISLWDSLYKMYTILRTEPEKVLKPGCPEGSKLADDYFWEYDASIVDSYKVAAETYYQLFCVRYHANALTPYMMKFIDYDCTFLRDLPLPFCRFQTEGGEHSHYQHQRFYMMHTTRHGGVHKTEPILSLFRNEYRHLSYAILHNPHSVDTANSGTADVLSESRKQFAAYVADKASKFVPGDVTPPTSTEQSSNSSPSSTRVSRFTF